MSTIQLQTPIPGPRSQALHARRASAIPRGLSHATPIYVAKAEDAWLEDVDGNRYLDFAGGIGCINVGHRREAVVEAVRLDHSDGQRTLPAQPPPRLKLWIPPSARVVPRSNWMRRHCRMRSLCWLSV